ncbi:MAG: DUF2630 family protein [Nitriliruptorales bacterium]|nr:DUF2630 family protein [Nitriliruptorales bacterium]
MAEQEPTLNRISALADEEHILREREAQGPLPAADRLRLEEVELLLDQCWDLLRQRRARRNAGLDPDDAEVRDIDTVENYRQ